ncbi:MAG: methyltransferase domain-containing protein [Bacteroidales bacterium]|nr:methyltransferase domain-containing protein [Bacteroidales bacterium]
MKRNYGNDNKHALTAKLDAQKIAWAPMMFQAARALRDFGILKLLLENKNGFTSSEVAEKIGISRYGATVLLEAGLSLELVYLEDDVFKLTKTGFFLQSDPLTKANMDFTQDVNYEAFMYLQESIKNSKPEGLHRVFGDRWATVYEALAEMPDQFRKSWFGFDHYYSDNAFPDLLEIVFKKSPKKILDVGGNTGKWSLQCVAHNPEVEMTILDHPGQLKEAFENAEKLGFKDRVKGHAMDLLKHEIPFPKGFDIVWMSQFLDCFGEEDILGLILRAKDALNENGKLYILETYWDDQKYEASTYSLHATSLYFTCVANGNSRMYHSDDMRELLDKAGMQVVETYHNVGISHTLMICEPKFRKIK